MDRTHSEWHWLRFFRLTALLEWSYGRDPVDWRLAGVYPPFSEERERRERALRTLRDRSYDRFRMLRRSEELELAILRGLMGEP